MYGMRLASGITWAAQMSQMPSCSSVRRQGDEGKEAITETHH